MVLLTMKRRLPPALALFAASPALFAAGLVQTSPPVRSADQPALVWDLAPELAAKGCRNFRTTADPLAPKPWRAAPDSRGLAALRASGSSEFSAAGLGKMLGRFSGPVTVFDLRQEDHGFVNGEPVSWYATNNWANVGKSNAEIVAEERARLAALAAAGWATLTDDSVKKAGAADAPRRTEAVVLAQTEEQLVHSHGAAYVRITVSDHARPTDEEVDRFVAAVRGLPPGGWVHFHCRAGRGRTTTFMALYDMLRNARSVPLRDIVDRQSLLAGDYDLLGKAAAGGDRNSGAAQDRADFVRAFYDYAKANPDGRPLTWSEWLRARP